MLHFLLLSEPKRCRYHQSLAIRPLTDYTVEQTSCEVHLSEFPGSNATNDVPLFSNLRDLMRRSILPLFHEVRKAAGLPIISLSTTQ